MGGGEVTLVDLLGDWLFWSELLITAVCGIFWAVQMNKSLGLYDPLFIIPLLQSSYITFGATASGIFYQEFRTLHEVGLAGPATWFFFIIGMIMIVVGILLLAPGNVRLPCMPKRASKPIVVAHTTTRQAADSDSAVAATATVGRGVGGLPVNLAEIDLGGLSGDSARHEVEIDLGYAANGDGTNGDDSGDGTSQTDGAAGVSRADVERKRRQRSKAAFPSVALEQL